MRRIEIGLLVFSVAGLCYTLVAWRQLLPVNAPFQPLRMSLLWAALALQPVASLSRARSRTLYYVVLAASLGLLVLAMLAVDAV